MGVVGVACRYFDLESKSQLTKKDLMCMWG